MAQQMVDRETYLTDFAEFVTASPGSYHTAHALAARLREAGFVEYHEADAWPALTGRACGFVRRDGALIAWRSGAEVGHLSPFRVIGSHTDSPGFVVKPNPDFTTEGWAQVGVEIYGGPLLNSWLDRDLAIAGRVVTIDGEEHLVRTEAVARIPQLAIHLDREVGSGLTLDRQRHTQPIIGVGHVSLHQLLANSAGLNVDQIAGVDVRLADAQPPARLGASREFLASPRLDNLSSVYASLVALLAAEPAPDSIAMLAAFDHEELGSETRSGASGPFLKEVITRLQAGLGAGVEERARALSQSWCLSSDAGHAVHPNYPEKHDPHVRPTPGGGPMLKVNANQRYATEAMGEALWRRCAAHAGVPTQEFVSHNAVPCGSTIGPLTAARVGMRTVDVGVPLLSMHSARELAHVDDLTGLARIATSFYAGA